MFADDSGDVGEGRVVNLSLPGCLLESSDNFSLEGMFSYDCSCQIAKPHYKSV